MKINAIFHVYESEKYEDEQRLIGRLLYDMGLKDKLILVKKANIFFYNSNHDSNGYICIDNSIPYEKIELKSIFSYGKSWETLSLGMSAKIVCTCNEKIDPDDVLYFIVEEK